LFSQFSIKITDFLDFFRTQFKLYLKNRDVAATNQLVNGGKKLAGSSDIKMSTIFALITRLRQFTVLPYLIHTVSGKC